MLLCFLARHRSHLYRATTFSISYVLQSWCDWGSEQGQSQFLVQMFSLSWTGLRYMAFYKLLSQELSHPPLATWGNNSYLFYRLIALWTIESGKCQVLFSLQQLPKIIRSRYGYLWFSFLLPFYSSGKSEEAIIKEPEPGPSQTPQKTNAGMKIYQYIALVVS